MNDFGFPKGGSKILNFLYLGGDSLATNIEVLLSLGITHVINCVEGYINNTGPKLYGKVIKYMGFSAEDDVTYDIMQHFDKVYAFIEDCRKSGGKVYIHCLAGINRSGALTVAYCMVHKNMGPISAAKFVKKSRKGLLTNDNFQKQVVAFARKIGLLHLDADFVK